MRQSVEDRRAFLAGLVETLRFDGGNKVLFVATESSERRFGFLNSSARAATASPVLENWVYPALARYLAMP